MKTVFLALGHTLLDLNSAIAESGHLVDLGRAQRARPDLELALKTRAGPRLVPNEGKV